ncbi:hypothetical protein DY000_02030555 [Brassica cretica]|uniref:Major facilitator superfamily (MFS) profile domain-containing protein n=1 Tax=Brassica cretica TaxID=69181 RepID=A0ABQ7DHP4_BRACR|nr:hypothetical protein DY000_02030555 [Brassica cretica]
MESKGSWTVADAVDYNGLPADKSKTGGWITAALILGSFSSLLFSSLLLSSGHRAVSSASFFASVAYKEQTFSRKESKGSWTVADAVDYNGLPADKSKTGGWITAALILGIEVVERLSTMGIAVNLVTYLMETMHLPSSNSANIVTDFMGTSFLLCLLGGFLADSFLGRFKTIAIFSTIQALVRL